MKIKQESIADFISNKSEKGQAALNKVFLVPQFQRPYSWTPENADDYLTDIRVLIADTEKIHYFGTIFYSPDLNENEELEENGQMMIIDGQQRITTTMLMLTAIYHLEKESGKTKQADQIMKDYLASGAFTKIKLRTVAYDSRILQDIFDTNGINLRPEEKRSNLWQVYRYFRKALENDFENIWQYVDVLKRFKVISIGIGEKGDDNPQRVFESINSTGKPLTDGDKIRNFALMLDDAQLSDRVYNEYWSKIENSLTDPDQDEITDFFRNYLMAKKQMVIRTDEVYNEFKKLFAKNVSDQKSNEIDVFYKDIIRFLKYYSVLVLGESGYNKTVIPEVAYKMRYIRAGLYVPFGLSVIDYYEKGKLTEGELNEIFGLIEAYFSRRIVCNISASSLDKVFSSLHQNVLDILAVEENANYVEILKFLMLRRTGQTRFPDDKELLRAIEESKFYEQRLTNVMYVLSQVNDRERNKESNVFKQIAEGELKLSVEHIMPQTINPKDRENGAKWVEMLGDKWKEIHETYLHTIGNLTLTGYNTEYSNRPYVDEKRPERSKMGLIDKKGNKVGFSYSDLALNSYIARTFKTSWGEKEIRRRDKWLLRSMQKMWAYPTTGFVPTVSDTSVSLLGSDRFMNCQINSVTIFGDNKEVGSWAEALDFIAETLYEYSQKTFKSALNDEYLGAFIRKSRTDERGFSQILDTNYYVRVDNSTNAKVRIIRALAKLYGLSSEDIKAEITRTDQEA